jgi:FlaA1/EpsC-like NDP-sugar epimerase
MTSFLSRQELASLATGRSTSLFATDIDQRHAELTTRLRAARVLVVGGAGSIGAATIGELSRFPVRALHVVDLSENGLAELVRDLRSRPGGLAIDDFRSLPLDFGSPLMGRFIADQAPYDFVLNFAAIKHVRSEKDSYSLLHMFDTNVVKVTRFLDWIEERGGTRNYFCVSTDKAANPVNLMGASKRLMEHAIFSRNGRMRMTSARFANVAFSDGSLLEGWLRRFEKRQALAVPRATRRFFLSLQESGQLCLLAAVCGPDRHLLIPRLDAASHLVDLEGIARALLQRLGFTVLAVDDEARARAAAEKIGSGEYPLLVTPLDTSGEKPYEEFVGEGESSVEVGMPNLLGVPYKAADAGTISRLVELLAKHLTGNEALPDKSAFVEAVGAVVEELRYIASEKQLDGRM